MEYFGFVVLLLVALAFYSWFFSGRLSFVLSSVFYFFILLLTVVFVAADSVTGEGINEAFFWHLSVGVDGLGFGLLLKYFAAFLFFAVISLVPIYFGFKRQKNARGGRFDAFGALVVFLLSSFAVFVHPAFANKSAWWSVDEVDIQELLDLDAGTARSFNIGSPKNKKNFLYIYLESVERTFFDEKVFPGLLSNLKEVEKGALSVHGIGQAPMTNWTMAGMVASQCGVPLRALPRTEGASFSEGNFYPGQSCVGDVLKEAGYDLHYLGGADLAFASKGEFYRKHGFTTVTGLTEVQKLGKPYPVSDWGIFDDDLYDLVFEKVRISSKTGKPFGVFMLTLDTHPPSGHVTPSCQNVKYGHNPLPMLNAVKCADVLIKKFLVRLEEAGLADDLVIVLASDHLQMRGDVFDVLNAIPSGRENMFMVRGKEVAPGVVYKKGTTLDVAPTFLKILGFDVSFFALGFDLLNEESVTLRERYGEERFYSQLQAWRIGYLRDKKQVKLAPIGMGPFE